MTPVGSKFLPPAPPPKIERNKKFVCKTFFVLLKIGKKTEQNFYCRYLTVMKKVTIEFGFNKNQKQNKKRNSKNKKIKNVARKQFKLSFR